MYLYEGTMMMFGNAGVFLYALLVWVGILCFKIV